MTEFRIPIQRETIERIAEEQGTPLYIYHAPSIRASARRLTQTFSWVPAGFRNYFAVKALPNPSILQLLHEEGMGADCSSLPELMIADAVGLKGKEIMFTSNDTPAHEFKFASDLGAIINFDDISHIEFFEQHVGQLPELACCRYNPGNLKKQGTSEIIGRPLEQKYGFTQDHLFEGYRILQEKGVKRFGLHAMLASNDRDYRSFVETAHLILSKAAELSKQLKISFDFVNLGGGIGIPYRPEEDEIDLEKMSKGIQDEYQKEIAGNSLPPLKIFMENGRFITGSHGFLITRAIHVMKKHRDYVGVDASMANLMRPGMYGAYHHISVLGKEHLPLDHCYDVVGGLCENNDKFAIQRMLPYIEKGDLIVIYNGGAHAHAMGFQYNGKLRCGGVLVEADSSHRIIRRKETPEDYFATLCFPKSQYAHLGAR